MELEDGYKKDYGSGNKTATGYTVEARNNSLAPIVVSGQIFDIRWRRVNFTESEVGISTAVPWNKELSEHGLLTYQSAQSLRWWLHAIGEREHAFCLETRLIEHVMKSSYTIEAVAQHSVVSGEDRSSVIPKWGATAYEVVKYG